MNEERILDLMDRILSEFDAHNPVNIWDERMVLTPARSQELADNKERFLKLMGELLEESVLTKGGQKAVLEFIDWAYQHAADMDSIFGPIGLWHQKTTLFEESAKPEFERLLLERHLNTFFRKVLEVMFELEVPEEPLSLDEMVAIFERGLPGQVEEEDLEEVTPEQFEVLWGTLSPSEKLEWKTLQNMSKKNLSWIADFREMANDPDAFQDVVKTLEDLNRYIPE